MEYHSQRHEGINMSKGTVFTKALVFLSSLHRVLVIQFKNLFNSGDSVVNPSPPKKKEEQGS